MSKPVTTIVRLPAKAGKSGDIASMVEARLGYIRAKPANSGANLHAPAKPEEPATLIEIWDSVAAHEAHVQQMVADRIYGR